MLFTSSCDTFRRPTVHERDRGKIQRPTVTVANGFIPVFLFARHKRTEKERLCINKCSDFLHAYALLAAENTLPCVWHAILCCHMNAFVKCLHCFETIQALRKFSTCPTGTRGERRKQASTCSTQRCTVGPAQHKMPL